MRVLLTGATGFLGMEVLVRLLQREDVEVVAVVRARDDEHAAERLRATLATLSGGALEARSRVRAVAGDVATEGLGLGAGHARSLQQEVEYVVHCAASVGFDLPEPEALAVNTRGTAHVLALAADMTRLERLLHVSTAYVAGRLWGVFRERDLERGQSFRNSYERSKFEAERLLAASAGELPLLVARPSIVVGDSRSGWTPVFNVLYWPLRAFARGLIVDAPVDPSGILDVVPVDYVADALAHLLLDAPALEGPVHLVAGESACTNAELIDLACGWLGRPRPPLRPAAGLPEQARAYVPYFDVHTSFDDVRARRTLAPAGLRARPLREFFPALLDYAERSSWGKRPLTREQASKRVAASPS